MLSTVLSYESARTSRYESVRRQSRNNNEDSLVSVDDDKCMLLVTFRLHSLFVPPLQPMMTRYEMMHVADAGYSETGCW